MKTATEHFIIHDKKNNTNSLINSLNEIICATRNGVAQYARI